MMLEIIYKDDLISFNLPKSFLKDTTIRRFLKYLKVLEIVNKSTASDKEIEELVKVVKEAGKKEMEQLLNEK
jgi:esterase/lipase superfamily enzyme